ncbi:hypothetical protein OV203_21080 [Nannocystis sp. ILAH1]|uniref:hypothetical protein n=1 Tax=unclassified Nannocystis TaxID=2627009 RepID=UPI002271A9F7|nr:MULTISPECIES: hypothetical protein [unclassified Nannocystis]MCY0989645.1 hypothetical protein [Nannocystis sp. ILAH1]MCY1071255.1 hypothetical protein [Nannocystis sp. RBIL2]
MARPLFVAWALALSACFTGGFLSGQPCTADSDCGPSLRCEAGVCGGPSAQTSPTTTTTTAAPTTTTTASDPTTVEPTSTTTTTTTTDTTLTPLTTTTSTGDEETSGGGCGIGRCKDLDLLFVADNSPSMLIKTLILLDFITEFGNQMVPELRQACSVHLGVVTTEAYPHNPVECQKLGALVTADNNGNPCTFTEGLPYATLPDLDMPLTLECLFNIGSDGDPDEKPVDTLFSTVGALDPSLNTGCNQGFYRPSAFLTVIMLADEDDDNNDAQGHDGSEEIFESFWTGSLTNIKPTGIDDLYMVGLLGDPKMGQPACAWNPTENDDGFGTETTPKLRAFIQSLPPERHAIDTLCNVVPGGNAYAALLQEVRAEIRAACGA